MDLVFKAPKPNASFANAYAYGVGVPRDYAEAARWLQIAAERGEASAQYHLALMYDDGQGVREDNAEPVRLYRLAAEQGLAGWNNLGVMYASSEGVSKDEAQARMWFGLAASRQPGEGRAELVRNRDRVASMKTLDQIAEAERLTREWLASHLRSQIEPPASER